ncbi:AMP-binding protein [Phytoactinopolyspora halotolerans]|uniref:AMP-binding protein n=1 Tax=Phytoactinopolyspora halotolerans TaxID=1981512 RepID=A0A6L9S7C8_9ACTN|nr:AMP-binding protein [Phytoactinopolyspora halotolerans]NEE00482.1 AMP-binding protein [Phytoactinopolyspora halotolerans]
MRLGRHADVWQGVAQAAPDRPAVVSRSRRLTHAEFTAEAAALARHLEHAGIRPGDSVVIYSYNRPEFLVTLYACLATGVAPVPLNFRYRANELRDLLLDCEARMLVYPSSLGAVVTEAIAGLQSPPAQLEVDDDAAPTAPTTPTTPTAATAATTSTGPAGQAGPTAVAYHEAVAEPGALPAVPPPGGELRLYTGGTTGMPKAVLWDTDHLLDGMLFSTYSLVGIDPPQTVEEAVAIAVDRAPRVATLPLAPFIHGTALFTSLNTLVLGGTVIIHASPRLDVEEALRLLHDEAATRLVLAGDAVALPLVTAAEQAGTGLGQVRSVISSGMRLSDETKRRLHALADLTIADLLAATEGGPFAAAITSSVDDLPARLKLMDDAAVLDNDGVEVQDRVGALGRLAFRGAFAKGYLGDEAKTRETFREFGGRRYVVPGDWARVLGDGHIELLGRGSAVVNTGGEKVYPAEVEQALLDHPEVDDAVVFGTPDRRFGEAVTAVIVPAAGASIDPAELANHLDRRLAGYKKPRHVLFRDSLERSPHGKLDLARLKRDATAELAERSAEVVP